MTGNANTVIMFEVANFCVSGEQQLLETVSGSVVFQYVEEGNAGTKNSEYYDNLNSWVGTAW